MKKKVLIIGGASLIGSTILQEFKEQYDIHLTVNQTNVDSVFPQIKLDLIDERDRISQTIKNINPDVVINTVAYPSVDFCETNNEQAFLLHVLITKDILTACNDTDSSLIYFSTDAVFDGKTSKPYTENDLPAPLSYYGKTKLEAEKLILQNKKNIVLRTTVVYGWYIRSRFTNWILKNLNNHNKINAFTDQNNTPTLVTDLSHSLLLLLEKNLSGLYHCSGRTCLSRYDFAIRLAENFGYDKSLIIPTISKGTQKASRPENGCLDSSKLENSINFQLSDIDKGIQTMVSQSKLNPNIFE